MTYQKIKCLPKFLSEKPYQQLLVYSQYLYLGFCAHFREKSNVSRQLFIYKG
ncbi:hypothetical protein VCR20J5_190016 [Vibrio crassostreae]|nr:hypothetical protein VCR20J5_190016 [Vibrio crassostreae]